MRFPMDRATIRTQSVADLCEVVLERGVGGFPTALATIQFTIRFPVYRCLTVLFMPSAALYVVETTLDGAFNSHRLHHNPSN